jgi:Protein of unknown function (DUF2804).
MEHKISGAGALLDEDGRLREPGWSDSLVLGYDRKAIRAPAWRIKEWDYYLATSRELGLALTIADNGYIGLISATVLDFASPSEVTESIMTACPMGSFGLPSSSASGVTEAQAGGARLRFEASGGERRLSFVWPRFGEKAAKGREGAAVGLEGELALRETPGGASMVIATPFARPRRAFYYNQKINCQSVEGSFRFGGRELRFEPASASAVLDWGRGVWPWSNAWLWGSASGVAARPANASGIRSELAARRDMPFGFNIGYGFGDTSAASENMVFAGGAAHKIGRLSIDLDPRDFMREWRVHSEDGRLEMRLTPLIDRAAATDLGILASIQHQVFGDWTGYAILDDGSKVEFAGLRGFCEKVVNRW